MCCGHTMLTARSNSGVEFPEVLVGFSARPFLSLSRNATFRLFPFPFFFFFGFGNSQTNKYNLLRQIGLTTCSHVSCAGTNSVVANPKRHIREVSAAGANGGDWRGRSAPPQSVQRGWTTQDYTLLNVSAGFTETPFKRACVLTAIILYSSVLHWSTLSPILIARISVELGYLRWLHL